MKSLLRFSIMVLGLGLAILSATVVASAQDQDANSQPTGYSHVRIVRLSFVEGTVTVQRPDVQEWAVAPANTPIQEGFKLSTAEQGFAEVEFENTSTARLGQLSLMDFQELALSPSGGKVNRMTLEQGYATFNVLPEGMEAFEVKAQGATITLAAGATTRFRVDLDGGAVRVEVFQGAANVSTSGGAQVLTKEMVADIRPDAEQAMNITHGITKDAWDQWVDERENQLLTVRNSPTPSNYGAGNNSYYGWNDLSNYGGWNYFPGWGYGWGPNVAFGWSPYSAGSWCWYPGFGYTWISSEPWGWLPYHNGGWSFMAGYGWAWFPGSFGTWYPGNVNWTQGAGWVGWSPNPPLGRMNSGGCAQGHYCGRIIVRPNVVADGRPVGTAERLHVNVTSGRTVIRPDITPSRSGMLPGPVVTSASAFTGKGDLVRSLPATGGAQVTSGINRVVVGETPGVRTAGPHPVSNAIGAGVAFDPASGRYVNSNTARPSAVNAQPGVGGQEGQAGGRSAAPFWGRSTAVPSEGVSPNQSGGATTTRQVPSSSRMAPGVVNSSSHSNAPTIRYTPSSSSGSHGFWGGSSSNSSSGGSGRSSSGGSYSGGGSSRSSGGGASYSGGGSSRSSGGSSGGGSGSTGGGSSSSGGGGHSSAGTHR